MHFGCQNDLIAAPTTLGQPSPNDLFGDPLAGLPSVNVGRVKKVDSQFKRPIHNLV